MKSYTMATLALVLTACLPYPVVGAVVFGHAWMWLMVVACVLASSYCVQKAQQP
jgi:hypothetical protein